MTLSDRDRRLTQYVAAFGQLTTAQARELIFTGMKSRTSCDNRLRSLVKQGYLSRIERHRLAGGAKGGAGQYAYTLGYRGHHMYFDGEYRKQRNLDYHQVLVVDSFLKVAEMASGGLLQINYRATGDDAAVPYKDANGDDRTLKPDMRLDLTLPDGRRGFYWFEIDMATEGKRQVKDKMARAWLAMRQTDPNEYPVAPVVVWVACDAERAIELQYLIDQGQDDGRRAFFKVCTLETLPALLTS